MIIGIFNNDSQFVGFIHVLIKGEYVIVADHFHDFIKVHKVNAAFVAFPRGAVMNFKFFGIQHHVRQNHVAGIHFQQFNTGFIDNQIPLRDKIFNGFKTLFD